MHCSICSSESKTLFKTKLMNKYNVQFFFCSHCGYMHTEKPYWLDEAYKNSINITDTGILKRNYDYARKVSVLLYYLFDSQGQFLDYGGGYGIFTRLMRDFGFDFYWQDPYTQNMLARGFEYSGSDKKIECLTSFEAFEHFSNPVEEVEKMLKISKNILFSTWLLPEPVPAPDKWWYYGTEHGQHISFYRAETLEKLSKKFNLNFYTNYSDLHLFTEKTLVSPKDSMIMKQLKKHFPKIANRGGVTRSNKNNFKFLSDNAEILFQKKVSPAMKSRTFDDMLFIRTKTEKGLL